MASNQFVKNDGWRTKGSKQLLTKNVIQACTLADNLEKQGIRYSVVIFCTLDFELKRAMDAWAGFQKDGSALVYRGVRIELK
jgi:hypothetical protein